MMVVRIYGLMWVLALAAASALYFTDSFTFATTMVLGFIASVLTGAGLLAVFPALMTERVSERRNFAKEIERQTSAVNRLQRVS